MSYSQNYLRNSSESGKVTQSAVRQALVLAEDALKWFADFAHMMVRMFMGR
jgi:hypothetical protein